MGGASRPSVMTSIMGARGNHRCLAETVFRMHRDGLKGGDGDAVVSVVRACESGLHACGEPVGAGAYGMVKLVLAFMVHSFTEAGPVCGGL